MAPRHATRLRRLRLAAACVALALLFSLAPVRAHADENPALANPETPAAADAPAEQDSAPPEAGEPDGTADSDPTDAAHADEPQLTQAAAAALVDQAGNLLFGLNEDQELPPASITKVMTAMVALDKGPALDEVVELEEPDLGGDSQMADYGAGNRVTFSELLRVMLVYSANDAAYNAAVLTAGSEEAFVGLMNEKAAELGMTHTHFVNSHGLEADGHYTSARDLVVMGRHAMEHYPFIAQTVALTQATTTVRDYEITFQTTDRLLGTFAGMRGIKTGAIAANFTFLGASGRGGVQLYSAVLGCISGLGRFDDTAALMEWGYAHYQQKSLSHPDWAVRVQPYAFDLGLRTITAAAGECRGSVWPGGGATSYASVLCRPNRLLETGTPYGWTTWSQDGRRLAGVALSTRPWPMRVSAWPLFSLSLFGDPTTLGVVADA